MKLKSLEVNAAGGISPNAPVIVIFDDNHFAVAKGDMKTRKTSLLKALLVATGTISKDNIDFVNTDSGKLEIGLPFVGNDRKNYEIRVTKSKYSLTYEGEALDEPVTTARKLLGAVGVSPMGIKDKDIDDIVKWLASYTTKGVEGFDKKRIKIKDGIKEATQTRAAANKSAKGIREYFNSEGLLDKEGEILESKWTANEKKYETKLDIADLSKKLTAAGNKSDKFIENESKTESQRTRKVQIEKQIAALQEELSQVDANISFGERWLEANKTAKKDYDTIKRQYDNAAQEVSDYNKWQEIKTKKKEWDEYETISQKADAKEKELLKEMDALRAEIIPDIKGVDLVLDAEMKDGKVVRREGLYWNGKNVAQLSESEWWSVVLMIWRKNKVKIIAIDNLQDLGTGARDILDKLVADGAYVLAAQMELGKKELEIEYQ